jgi:two-component system sensor histidine kinase BaeS
VVTNLFSNAVEYTPHGGVIDISAHVADGAFELRIKNSQTGIEAADLPCLFEAFWRADESRTGSASHSWLGLAIVSMFVHALGGQVRAEMPTPDTLELVLTIPAGSERTLDGPLSVMHELPGREQLPGPSFAG